VQSGVIFTCQKRWQRLKTTKGKNKRTKPTSQLQKQKSRCRQRGQPGVTGNLFIPRRVYDDLRHRHSFAVREFVFGALCDSSGAGGRRCIWQGPAEGRVAAIPVAAHASRYFQRDLSQSLNGQSCNQGTAGSRGDRCMGCSTPA
jgi:hypothetical protein